MPIPPSVFVDGSVFFAAAYSTNGSAHDLFLAAIRGDVSLVLARHVLAETERNLLASAPRAHSAFRRLIDSVPHELVRPAKSLIIETARVIAAKDAPIIAAARRARAGLVATYDRKDLLSKRQEISVAFGLEVTTPDKILARIGPPIGPDEDGIRLSIAATKSWTPVAEAYWFGIARFRKMPGFRQAHH